MKWTYRLALGLAVAAAGTCASEPVEGATGPIVLEGIVCEGNDRTSCDYLIHQTTLEVGKPIVDEDVETSRYRLRLMSDFEEVTLRLSKGSEVGKAILTIAVVERSPYSVNVNFEVYRHTLGYPGNLDLTLFDRNLTGQGDLLSFRVSTDGYETHRASVNSKFRNTSFRLEYTRPAIFSPRSFATFGVTHNRYSSEFSSALPDQFGLTDQTSGSGWGADAALGYRIFDFSYVMLGGEIGTSNSNTNFLDGSDPNHPILLDSSTSSSGYWGLFAHYGWDTEDNPNIPTQGSKFQFRLNWGRFNSDFYSYSNWSVSAGYRNSLEIFDSHILSLILGNFWANDDRIIRSQEPGVGLRYAYLFKRHANSAFTKNAALYVEPGFFSPLSYGSFQGLGLRDPGISIGTTLETSFGLLNFSFTAVSE